MEEFLVSDSLWQFIYMRSSLISNDFSNFRLHHIVDISKTAILPASDWNTILPTPPIFFF